MANKIILRRDLAVAWTNVDPILSNGEIGLETDTGRFKIGNGSSAWADLPYYMRADDIAAQYNGTLNAAVATALDHANAAGDHVLNAAEHVQTAENYLQATIDKASEADTYRAQAQNWANLAGQYAQEASALDDEAIELVIQDNGSATRQYLDNLYGSNDALMEDVISDLGSNTRVLLDNLYEVTNADVANWVATSGATKSQLDTTYQRILTSEFVGWTATKRTTVTAVSQAGVLSQLTALGHTGLAAGTYHFEAALCVTRLGVAGVPRLGMYSSTATAAVNMWRSHANTGRVTNFNGGERDFTDAVNTTVINFQGVVTLSANSTLVVRFGSASVDPAEEVTVLSGSYLKMTRIV
jgi:hypothetical protein